jgi:purine-binding chemotaxis protein CheW
MVDPHEQFCTFSVDRYTFAVEVHKVQEVLRFQHMTRAPLAPVVVRGLINLRGQIVTAIDLRRRLGLPDAPSGTLPMNVILRTEHGAVSLLVDKIGDVREVSRNLFEPAPDTLRDLARDVIRGVYKLPDRLLIALDAERIIAAAGAQPPTAAQDLSGAKPARTAGNDPADAQPN